jgi:hypothetical protein
MLARTVHDASYAGRRTRVVIIEEPIAVKDPILDALKLLERCCDILLRSPMCSKKRNSDSRQSPRK